MILRIGAPGMRLGATASAAAIVIALCSCVGTPQPDPSASQPRSGSHPSDDATTPQPLPSAGAADGPPEASTAGEVQLPALAPPGDVPRASVDRSKGAKAAPDAPAGGVADMSQEAADAFAAWWAYEAPLQDLQRDGEKVWSDGVSVCAQLALNATTGAILDVLEHQKGYAGSGAAAVYASAVRALCPHRNTGVPTTNRIDGYLTYFDHRVARAYDGFLRQWNFHTGRPPQIYEMGWLTKTACNHLIDTDSTAGLLEKVSGLPYWDSVTPYPRVVETATVEAARSYCFILSDRLGGAWYE